MGGSRVEMEWLTRWLHWRELDAPGMSWEDFLPELRLDMAAKNMTMLDFAVLVKTDRIGADLAGRGYDALIRRDFRRPAAAGGTLYEFAAHIIVVFRDPLLTGAQRYALAGATLAVAATIVTEILLHPGVVVDRSFGEAYLEELVTAMGVMSARALPVYLNFGAQPSWRRAPHGRAPRHLFVAGDDTSTGHPLQYLPDHVEVPGAHGLPVDFLRVHYPEFTSPRLVTISPNYRLVPIPSSEFWRAGTAMRDEDESERTVFYTPTNGPVLELKSRLTHASLTIRESRMSSSISFRADCEVTWIDAEAALSSIRHSRGGWRRPDTRQVMAVDRTGESPVADLVYDTALSLLQMRPRYMGSGFTRFIADLRAALAPHGVLTMMKDYCPS